MSALWTAAEAAAATAGKTARGWMATGVSIDSRTVAGGDLFVGLTGPNFDAHDFAGQALAKGATAAMVSRVPAGLPVDAPLLVVEDTQIGLERLGAAARARTAARVIGVTGSVGKTGTKEMLRAALEKQGATIASAASYNNQWGVPLSLARMPAATRFGIFELGMNHAGELAALASQVQPHVAIVTTVEATHLGHFASVEAIADAKAEIFLGVAPDGVAILNRDNPYFERLAAAARARGIRHIVGFGAAREADCRLLDCTLDALSSEVEAEILGRRLRYTIGVPGRHVVQNSLAVLAAVKSVGAELDAAAAALAGIEGLAGRGRRHTLPCPGGSFALIDESYNASPASMRAALAVLARAEPEKGGRRIAVLGDMLELGADSAQLHESLREALDQASVNHVFTTGRDMRRLHDALPAGMRAGHAASSRDLAPTVKSFVRSGDVVMVKGSLGSRMAEIVKALLR